MEMKKYKLGEIAEILNGSTPSTLDSENYDGEIVWATPKDLSDQKAKYFYKGARNITEKGFNSCSTQMIPAGNILMSSRAPIGLFAINKVDCCTNQGFKNIIFDKSVADVEFMYYFLKFHVREIEALGSGTTFKEVSKSSLEKYEFSLPPLPTQQKIAAVLSSLDKKIALNSRINARLEQMAKRLYEHYFVQFDFPTADGKPYKTSGGKMVYSSELKREIPEGWEVKRLGDILENNIEVTDAGEHLKGLKYCPIDEIPMKTMSFANGKPYTEANSSLQLYKRKDILIGAMRVYFHRCCIASEPGITRTTTIVLSPKNKNFLSYVYQVCNEDKTFDYAIKVSNGTQQPYVTWKSLKEYQFVYPKDEKIIEDFCKNTNSIIDRILENVQESARLTSLRDRLLPLLMNGQVSV